MESMPRFRLMIHGKASGAYDMAVDEALLESVSSGKSGPVIRFYEFEHNTLSVGRFQKALEEFDTASIGASGVSLVRRPTGGRAVLHNHELTYSVVLGRKHLEPFGKRKVYAFIVPILLSGLAELGITEAVHSAPHGDLRSPDCFAATGEYEIDSGTGKKLIGSAQTVTREAVLQHGSLPLESRERDISRFLLQGPASDPAKEPPVRDAGHAFTSIADELGRVPGMDEVKAAFVRAVGKRLPCIESDLTEEELAGAQKLTEEKYGTTVWNLMY